MTFSRYDWSKIDRKIALLDSARPFPTHSLSSLREKMALEWTHHSNAIEGNTLTLKETKVVLEGITVGGKSVKEHLEAINHQEAIQCLEAIAQGEEQLTEWQIKNLHAIILKNIDAKNAGVYRSENVVIAGAAHTPPDFLSVPDEMRLMMSRHGGDWKKLHPAERAALLHIDFVKIHPFVDGNGRTGRLLHNFELIKHGFPPAIVQKENRLEYYECLDMAHTKNETQPFMAFSEKRLHESLDLYLTVLGLANPE